MPISKHQPVNIEFGGGENPQKKDYIQIDIRKIRDSDIVCNAWDVEKHINLGSVSKIYSRHFFEHLTHEQAKRTLNAWYNICMTGAEITMIVPNMNLHIWQWNNWDKLSEKEKGHCRAGFWGWQRESDLYSWDLHKSGYDFKKLKEIVEQFKFKDFIKFMKDGNRDKHLAVKFYK